MFNKDVFYTQQLPLLNFGANTTVTAPSTLSQFVQNYEYLHDR